MKPIQFPKSYKILVPTLLAVVIIGLCMPRTGEFEYHYRKGHVWNYETLVAPFDFPILKTADQISLEKKRQHEEFIPYFHYSPELFRELEYKAIDAVPDSFRAFARVFVEALRPMYERGVLPDNIEAGGELQGLTDSSLVYINRDKKTSRMARSELYSIRQLRTKATAELCKQYSESLVDSLLNASMLLDILAPNLVYDKQITQALHKKDSEAISPTSGVFKAGNVIISTSDIVTADTEQILDSYKAEYEQTVGYNGPIALLWLGNFMMALVLVCLLFTLVLFSRPVIFQHPGQYYFILTVYTISAVVTFIFDRFPAEYLYLMPYPVFALYYMAFFRKRLVLSLYTLSLLPLLVGGAGSQYFLIFLFAGFAAVYSFTYFNRGWRQFISAFIVFVTMLLVYFGLRFAGSGPGPFAPMELIFLFCGAMFTVLAYPLIYLFELIFSLVSVDKLKDLADTSNPLLRDLADKAPGTFQHSVSLMNMTEFVGRAVDADLPLLRAASLYHDIGKSLNPQCYVENQTPGQDFHAGLSPKESASEIIAHVTRGLDIAEKHGLPTVIRDFISTHHGTTKVAYFLSRYLDEGGDPDDVEAFCYPGPPPSTKEQIILMLCDTVEAASRTFKDYTPETVSAQVDQLYDRKFSAGQFDHADISLGELDTVKQNIKNYILQVHHARIAYPENKQENK